MEILEPYRQHPRPLLRLAGEMPTASLQAPIPMSFGESAEVAIREHDIIDTGIYEHMGGGASTRQVGSARRTSEADLCETHSATGCNSLAKE